MRTIVGFALLAGGLVAASVQHLFKVPSTPGSQVPLSSAEEDEYQFKWPIQRVAVIGAGPSGLVAYRELTEAGFDVRVFERDTVPGGNWHYTDEIPLDAPVPNAPCAVGDFLPSFPPANVELPYSEEFEDNSDIRRDHRGPKPVWESLTSVGPSPLQQFPKWPWPAGTRWELTQYQIRNYVRSYASYLNINSNDENPATAYNTRVERVEKRVNEDGQEQGWRLWVKSLEPTRRNTYKATWWTEDFDAVVVATGRYSAPLMPSIPGLQEWVRMFPDLVRHSRQYRRPESYVDQTVLIIGASVSGSEISKDVNPQARKIYQSVRPTNDSVALARLERSIRRIPRNTSFVGEIRQFLPIPDRSPIQSGLVELKNGTILSGIDSVILATGFRYSFPFLRQYYDDATDEPHAGSATTPSPFLPAGGSYLRDLYLDTFYIWDPTLAFLSVTRGPNSIFLLADYAALALAKVWTNTAKLPNSQTMQALYEKVVEERGGYGRVSQLTREQFEATIRHMAGWLNEAAVKYGGKQIDAYPKSDDEFRLYWDIAHFGGLVRETVPEGAEAVLAPLGLVLGSDVEQGGEDDDWLYYDDW